MNTEKKWTALGVLLGVTLMATIGAVLVGVDSDDRPQPQDTQGRSLIKINEILYNSIQGKGTNQINTSSVGTNTISGTVNLNSNTNQVVALPLIRSTFVQFTVTGATAGNTNGNAITPILTFTNSSGIPGTLLSASYWCNTNAPGIVDTIVGFYGTNAPTALGANGAVNMTYQDATNWAGHVEFFNFLGSSSSTRTNMRCTITAPPITILPGVNYLLITANSQWTNNPVNGGNNPTDTLIINWQ